MPPRQLIQSIVNALDEHANAQGLQFQPLTVSTMSRWYEARRARSNAERREGRERRRAAAKQTDGAPPASMDTYADLLDALNALVAGRFRSQRAMCRAWHLSRPTVSAALGDRRSLGIGVMDEILRVCGVRGTDHQAWRDAWQHLARPRQQPALERQQAGYNLTTHGHEWPVAVTPPPNLRRREDDVGANKTR